MSSLVIDSPSLQSLRQKYISSFLTMVFWILWIFLWTPLITLVAWISGMDLVYFQMVELEGGKAVAENFLIFLEIVAGMGVLYGAWAAYNYLRYGKLNRRTALPPVTNEELGEFFQVDPFRLAEKQDCQCISVRFDVDGNITGCIELSQFPVKI
jgi:biofilm PGA synthesis protein PgaD